MNMFSRRRLAHASACASLLALWPGPVSAQDQPPDTFRELESKYIFGFLFGSDIGPEGERELELTTNIDFQKRTGSFVGLEQEVEFEYNPTGTFQIELGASGTYTGIDGVDGFDNFHGVNFGGLHATLRYLIFQRGPESPVGLQLAIEPEWFRVDDGGHLITNYSVETRLIADTELVPDRLYAAFNLIYAPEWERDFGSAQIGMGSTLGFAGALTFRITPDFALGTDLEYYRAYDGAGLNSFSGDALFAGPTLYYQFTNKFKLSVAYSTQLAGHGVGDPNAFDLGHFTRNKALLRVLAEF